MSDGTPGPSKVEAQYVQYVLWRLDPMYHNLESNERIVAKQHFVGTWESFQSRALFVSYAVTGLRSDCDILSMRVSTSLELLQDMTTRLQSSGTGRFLSTSYSFLARASGPRYAAKAGPGEFAPGQGRYLFLSPWTHTAEWHGAEPETRATMERALEEEAARRGLRLHPGLRGLDEVDELLAVEADKPEEYLEFADQMDALRGQTHSQAGPTFVGILKDLRDHIDTLG